MRWKPLAAVAVLYAVVVAPSCVFTVDRTEYVYLTQFGRHLVTFDGGDDAQAGLHFKWPWPVQSVQRLDRRLQYFDLPGAELLTRDRQRKTIDRTLTLDAYVCWRIAGADGADRFLRRVGTPAGAQAVLGQHITSELGIVVGRMELDDLISTDPGRVDEQRGALRWRLLHGADGVLDLVPAYGALRGAAPRETHSAVDPGEDLAEMARTKYGIEVVDIRLRRASHPPSVREAIFARIKSERDRKRAEYESEGEYLKKKIESEGRKRVEMLRAQAAADALKRRKEADAEADRIRNEAQARDPEFYTFLKKLEEYQRLLGDNKTTLLLSTHRELFDVLFNPPDPGRAGGVSPPSAVNNRGANAPRSPINKPGGP